MSQLFRNRLDSPARADALLEQMVAGNPRSARPHRAGPRSRAERRHGPRRADVATALSLANDLDTLLAAADYFIRARRFGEAAEVLDRAHARAPGNDDRVERVLGDLDTARGDRKAAVQVFQGILDRNPDEFGPSSA